MDKHSLTPAAVALLYTLAVHIEEGKRWRLRIETLCEESGLSRSTVIRSLAALAEAGIVEEKRTGRASFYSLHLDVEVECERSQIDTSCQNETSEPESARAQNETAEVSECDFRSPRMRPPLKGPLQGPSQTHLGACGPEVVDQARESTHTHTHKGEDLVSRFSRALNAMKANPPPVQQAPLAPPSDGFGEPRRRAAPPPLEVDEGGWVAGSFEYAPAPPRPEEQERSNDGWGYTPEEQAEADRRDAERAKEQPNHAGEKTTLPQLEELILERTRGRRGLSLPALTAASLSALVDRYGIERVVEETMGIIEPVDQPVMMLTKRLERVATERPRAPNGNRW